jgi:hypothetical protein
MIMATDYFDVDERIHITFIDGQYVIGHIESVVGAEESELGETGISFWREDGTFF